MKKIIKTIGTLALILIAQNYYSQQKTEDINKLKFRADNIVNNIEKKIVTFTGNATLENSNSFSFDSADKMVYNANTATIEIYKPKNFKIVKVNAITKTLKSNQQDLVIYNVKEDSIIF